MVSAGLAATGSALLIARFIKTRIDTYIEKLIPTKTIIDRMDQQDKVLKEIQSEVKANGGKSLKDIIVSCSKRISVQEARINSIALTSPIAMYECDINGKCIWANEAICNLFGLDNIGMMGYGWLEAIEDENRMNTQELWDNCIKKGIPYATEYVVINQRDGKKYNCRSRAIARRDENGQIILFHGFVNVL